MTVGGGREIEGMHPGTAPTCLERYAPHKSIIVQDQGIRRGSLSLATAGLFLRRPFLDHVLICNSGRRGAQLYPPLNVLCGRQARFRKLSGRRDMGSMQHHAGVGFRHQIAQQGQRGVRWNVNQHGRHLVLGPYLTRLFQVGPGGSSNG